MAKIVSNMELNGQNLIKYARKLCWQANGPKELP